MNLQITESQIKSAFASPKKTLRKGTILIPAMPVNLAMAAKATVETDQDQNEVDNSDLGIVYEQLGWGREPLFRFGWQSFGPMVCEAFFELLHVKYDFALACIKQDANPRWVAFAGVKQPSDPAVQRSLFSALIRRSGAAFGIKLFGSLPSLTHNRTEDTIPEKYVSRAYWEWTQWAEKTLQLDWPSLMEEVCVRTGSPIFYGLELLRKTADEVRGDPAAWIEERKRRNSLYDQGLKRIVFNAYFKLSYGLY